MTTRFSTMRDLEYYVSDHVGPLANHEFYRSQIVAEICRRIRAAATAHDLEWGQDWSVPLEEEFGAETWITVLGEVCAEVSADYVQRVEVSLSPEDAAAMAIGQGRHSRDAVVTALQVFALERHPLAEISVRIGPRFAASYACVDGCEELGADLLRAFLSAQDTSGDVVMPEGD